MAGTSPLMCADLQDQLQLSMLDEPLVLLVNLLLLDIIHLFSFGSLFSIVDHVIFSRELFFYLSKNYSFIRTGLFENLKAMFPKSIITWSEMGQQNVQAKEVY